MALAGSSALFAPQRYTGDPGFGDVNRDQYEVGEFVKKFCSKDLEFEPGSKFNYNNSGYFLLGAIIEKVTGKPYAQVVKENIFDPLGMKNTGYDLARPLIAKRASGYQKTGSGYINAPYLDMSLPDAAGSLYSAVDDLYLWDRALYTDKVLSAKSRELMFTPFLENYVYGFGIDKTKFRDEKANVRVISHGGGINGFNTMIVRLVDQENLIVMLNNTAQGRAVDTLTRAITAILYNQPYEVPKPSVGEAIMPVIMDKGVAAAIQRYRDLKAAPKAEYDFSEPELNTIGYTLMSMRRIKDAIEIFKLNVEMFPKSSNPYDSLGEAYLADGNNELGLLNYKKALELDPSNQTADAVIKRLENPGAQPKFDPALYDSFAGEYELAPGFVITISREGERLMAQATNQQKLMIYQKSELEYFYKAVDARITFVRDSGGKVTALVLSQGGREMPATKVR